MISFSLANSNCDEREESGNFKIKKIVHSGVILLFHHYLKYTGKQQNYTDIDVI